MLTKNISFKNFRLKKYSKKIKKDFDILVQCQYIFSFTNEYSFDGNVIFFCCDISRKLQSYFVSILSS